jgi:L-ascorbate metabolism protein UlaG (beta-lactamase superfamily)
MEVDGVAICHLGDIGHVLADEQVEQLGKVDILMVPVGGVSTINASMAAEIVRKLEPKAVLPMHYKTPKTNRDLEPVENFLKEMGLTQVETRPKFSVTRTNLPLSMQVVLLTA